MQGHELAGFISNSAFWRGFRDGAPFVLVVAPFGALFGVVATEAGLTLLETMTFTTIVIAGAAQFTALQLMQDNAPTLVVLASALAVNLRMAMYSASLAPHLGKAAVWQRALIAYLTVDQSYALSITRYETTPSMTLSQKVGYFFGTTTPVFPSWVLSTLAGAWVGSAVPDWMALDFAVPITFIALIAPMLRTPAHVAAAVVSVVAALVFAFLPYNLGLIVSGVLAMIAGAEVERRMEARLNRGAA